MSGTLMWKPVVRDGSSLPVALKWALQKRSAYCRNWTMKDIPYLEGLVDGQVEGAQELLAAIEKHGEVITWIEY